MKKLLTGVSAAVLASGFFFSLAVPAFADGTWTPTGSMNAARRDDTATLLSNGKVLVVGVDSTPDLYDPATGAWTPAGSMNNTGGLFSATTPLLNGKVLVVGGYGVSSAELFDPVTAMWTLTGSMDSIRWRHTVTLLPNGKVLVACGQTDTAVLSSTELYDPAIGTWTPTGSMNVARRDCTATLLSNGEVLVAGGDDATGASLFSAELYDPSTGIWTLTGSMNHARGRFTTATLLPNGKVLVVGGVNDFSAELYDPSTGVWTLTGSMNSDRFEHTATLLQDGKVLVAGGIGGTDGAILASAELYDPTTGIWTPTNSMNVQRARFAAALLPSGKVLVDGGYSGGILSSAELYDPGDIVNHTPVLDPIGNQTVNEGQTLSFTVNATDPDTGDTLTYSATNTPPGSTFDPVTHTFTWTPDYTQAGNYPDVEFMVTDDGSPMMLDLEDITITVGDVNRAPVLSNPGPQQVLEHNSLTFTVSATDPDGNAVTLSATGLPTGATFDPATGVFSWTPGYPTAGVYTPTFIATDDGTPAASSSVDVVITVGSNPTPSEQDQSIVNTVVSYNLPSNIQNQYLQNLDKASQYITQGRTDKAISELNKFINKVNSDYSQGTITLAEENQFISLAQALISSLQ